MSKELNRFFVYGTLKVGGYFASQFDNVRVNSQPATLIKHDLYGIGSKGLASFPGAVPGEGKIVGEVHTYDSKDHEKVLRAMDAIEGYSATNEKGSLYLRAKKDVILDNGETVEAFVYIFNQSIRDDYEKVETGIWEI